MKIKRYTASSMRAALALVRNEQGPDAVILSSRRGDEGIEVIAAIDYDEALFSDAKRQAAAAQAEAVRTAVPAPASHAPAPRATVHTDAMKIIFDPAPIAVAAPASLTTAPGPARAAVRSSVPSRVAAPQSPRHAAHTRPAAPPSTAPSAASKPAAPARDFGYTLMQREMQEMRRLLETGMAGMTWNDKRLREPLKAQVLEQLSALDIAPDVALSIAEQTPRSTSLEDTSHIAMALLLKRMQFFDDRTSVTGGITALVGPTGAGKTTTIAKLAARWCLLHGSKDLALISTDSYRIGAREQLMTYARILDAPMHTANSGKELARLLERLSAKKLILIDTAGMGPRDVRLTEQLAALKLGAAKAKVLLALPSQAEGQALEEIVRAFARANPSACILTKIDEASSLGGVLSAVLRHQLKIAYVCNGQKVPEDMHAAQEKRVWLARVAQQMKQQSPTTRNEAYLAHHFGRTVAHA
jgi:flagellar biosynthesis protein FlhF